MSDSLSGESFFGGGNAIHAGGNTGINRYLKQDFDDLFAGDTRMQSSKDMELQLFRRRPHCHQSRDRQHLSRAKIDTRTRHNVRE